ncbi:MAG: hypothetical protein AAB316_02815 [Bacteroidota bacterium]
MLSDVRKQKFEYLFRVFDKSGGGTLTQSDLKSLFAGLATNDEKSENARKAARRWWLLLSLFADKNNDKRVSRKEWKAWLDGMSIEAGSSQAGSRTFQRWAEATYGTFSNNDNEVTDQEYRQWHTAFGLSGDAGEAFQKVDANGNGVISRDEFMQRLREFVSADDAEAAGNYLWGNPF